MRCLLLFVFFLFTVPCTADDPFWLEQVQTPSFAEPVDASIEKIAPSNSLVVTDIEAEQPVVPVAKKDWIATHLVVYSAKWCRPCQTLKPKFLQLKKLGYRVVIRDYDKLPRGEYRPKVVPEIHLFDMTTWKKGHGLTPFSSIEKFTEVLELPQESESAK